MQEHPVPRQITTFEFKLIGELTIKQFGFLAFGIAIAVILYFLIPPILYINILAAAIPALLGIGFAFVPVNDRPMDIWLKNVFKRLLSPTQYFYHKHNSPPKILLGLQLPPREVLLQHIKAQQALNEYQQKKPKTDDREAAKELGDSFESRKRGIQAMMIGGANNLPEPPAPPKPGGSISNFTEVKPTEVVTTTPSPQSITPAEPTKPVQPTEKPATAPLFSGTVFTTNGLPLSGLMVYIKQGTETIRLFRTDAQGHFQNNLPLPSGDYYLEVEDPQKKHTFARMKIDQSKPQLEIFAQT